MINVLRIIRSPLTKSTAHAIGMRRGGGTVPGWILFFALNILLLFFVGGPQLSSN